MGSSFPIKFALFFSLSLGAAAAVPLSLPRNLTPKSKATTSDLLSLLGSPHQAASVNSVVARQLRSCFKFLAPFNQTLPTRRALTSQLNTPVDYLIRSPPPPVLELARLAVDSGGDPGAIHRALDPTIITVPDVEGSNQDRCELTRYPYGWRFIDEALNSYIELLFEIIVERGPGVGLNVSLSRYDFFHGHLFLAKESGRLGILFHAKEYPAYDKELFPCNMGYCQVGSNVTYDDSMNLRNILWLAPLPNDSRKAWDAPGVLVVLDAHPEGIIYRDLIPEYVHIARTLYEDDFGEVVVDVNYLNVGGETSKFQLFVC
ncbi:uncharacterized protein LOC125218759 [Salvia hispanica]|uniref:uncharacterized protein LOC125218759 n=1 Tax=Salvia hispanica TaxID=49212 RepID=UPI00200939EB|nr:uncharacterized protein LOC125218759 [Salvia hispanica]